MATANTTQPLSPFLNTTFGRTATSQAGPHSPHSASQKPQTAATTNVGFPGFGMNLNNLLATSTSAYGMLPLMQQFMKSGQYGSSPNSAVHESESRASSTSMSLNAASPGSAAKKLQCDNEGNITCPICEEKVGPNSYLEHLEFERKSLLEAIKSLKSSASSRSHLNSPQSASHGLFDAESLAKSANQREKRNFELQRIRLNQQKRLQMKSHLLSTTPLRASMERNHSFGDEINSQRSGSTLSLNSEDKNYCKSCDRIQEFLVISVGLDEPRCMECFYKYRRQVGALPLTITESPTEDPNSGPSSTNSTKSPSQFHSIDENSIKEEPDDAPTPKRCRLDSNI
ncbi:unnamed protein product [Bursaphelenchus xylophilus]|uniref:(pine wood nematode) hypothetical protein n=1 Tax=Bursaphelenchus xylophilus TaxID=6326 RepID=A0A1I7SX76_BURXY|nr:unnamed protein product [Bursaphelenchus xylophilus]CAG9100234.1 unnamed protein product [Bursaphelenchus xylophilus]